MIREIGEFAKKYTLPLKQVILPKKSEANTNTVDLNQHAFVDEGLLMNSGPFTNLTSKEAFNAIAKTVRK